MMHNQFQIVVAALAGSSLFLHLCSAGNFASASEAGFFGSIFCYIHSSCNLAARLSLLSVMMMIAANIRFPNSVSAYINRNVLPKYLLKLMTIALLCTAIRFLIPGSVSSYSRFYKLSLLLSFFATVFAALNSNAREDVLKSLHPSKVEKKKLDSDHSPPSRQERTLYVNGLWVGVVMGNCCRIILSFLGFKSDYEELDDDDQSITSPLIPPSSRESDILTNSSQLPYYVDDGNTSNFSDSSYIPSKRHRTAIELLQTETSYLRNLNTIITLYKDPLEKAVADGEPLLAQEDIRTIFGGIKEIANLHTDFQHDVSQLIDNWEEDCCVAAIIEKYKERLIKVYPPYVNYFDMGKETLLKRQQENTDLQTFFLKCFHDPRSLKQTLDALLIRPVQRLPSLLLLTSDLQKRTPKELQDHADLEDAKEALKQVLSHINEDKRKTEGKMKIFDIVYEVNECPVEVVSSNRLYVTRVDVSTLTDGFYRMGERLALYLLTDMLEIAKWRNRSHGKSLLKHILLLPLSNIITVMDVEDQNNCTNLFAVRYIDSATSVTGNNANGLSEEKVSVLQLLDDKTFKASWINSLVTQIAEVKGLRNTETILCKVKPSDLLNFTKKNTKLHKKLKAKPKAE